MDKTLIFRFAFTGFLAGAVAASFLDDFSQAAYLLAAGAVLAGSVFYDRKQSGLILLGVALFFLGGWYLQFRLDKNLNASFPTRLKGEALIVRDPDMREEYQQLIIMMPDDPGNKYLVRASRFERYRYGEKVRITCDLDTLGSPEQEGYRMYLAKSDIRGVCKSVQIGKTGDYGGSGIYAWLLEKKDGWEKIVNRTIPQPQAALANGLLFGGTSRLSSQVSEEFSKTGMTHIVAVSGHNVTIIAEYLMALGILLGLWRRQAFWFAVGGIILFVLVIGFPSSAIRAAVMGILILWAMRNGRLSHSWNALLAAAVVMAAVNPLILRWDIGFQLSFLATAGIIATGSFWEKIALKKINFLGVAEMIALTISAQIFVWPIIALNFKNFSLISILANALVLPIVPLTMALVFWTVVLGMLFPPLAILSGWPAYGLLRYETGVISWLAGAEWANFKTDDLRWQWAILWYVAIIVAIYFFNKHKREKTIYAPIS